LLLLHILNENNIYIYIYIYIYTHTHTHTQTVYYMLQSYHNRALHGNNETDLSLMHSELSKDALFVYLFVPSAPTQNAYKVHMFT
jgi:hypothetical protein